MVRVHLSPLVEDTKLNTDLWGYSSVGRAPALQAGGHEFESRYLHENMSRADRDETRVACESRERKVKHSQETYVYQYVP